MLGFPARPDLQPSNEDRHGWRTPHLRYRRPAASSRGPAGGRILDGLTAILAAGGIVMMFSARADYARWPLLGLLLPGLRALASSAYRQRLLAVLRGYRASVDAFARGGGVVPWAAAVWLVAAPVFLLYLTNATIEGAIDTRPIVPTAVSLVREANWSLDEFDRPGQPRGLRRADGAVLKCFQERGGRIYTAYPPGIVAFAVPVAAMSRICGADLDAFWVQLRLEKITAALLGSLCLGQFFLAACRVGPPSAATVATAMLAVASGMFSTVGTGLWQHGAVVFWILAVLLVELRSSGRPLRGGTAVQAIGCAALLACRPTTVILVAGVGLWILARAPRRAIVTMAAAAVCYLPCMALYHVLYGNVLGPASISTHMSKDLWHFGEIVPPLGVLASPSRGLLVYQPWAVLAALSAVPLIRRKAVAAGFAQGAPGWLAFCLAASAVHCIFIASWFDWTGGHCWGSRLLTDILPLLGLASVPAIAALWPRPRARSFIVALGLLGALSHIPCVYLGASEWNDRTNHKSDNWSWSNAPFWHYRHR